MINKKRKGFTLPEILAVVAILILLVGIAVPGYERLTQKSDVSDALHNLEMLSSAQSKYFIANGNYTRNLNALQTPLKSKDGGDNASITTTNFTYSAGSVVHSVGHEQFCVFSESNKNDYVLAYNYKTNVGPICSGSFCPEISNIVPEGSISELCGGEYNSTCDLTCTSPFVLNKKECACVCGKQCGAYAEQSGDCSCHCIGQATMGATGCKCPESVESSCTSAGLAFDSAKCDCTDCGLTEEFCNSMKKVLDVSNCQCVEPANPNAFCDLACPAGKVLDEDKCECKCAKIAKCLGEKEFNNDTCQCECPESITCPSNKILNQEKCSCDCNPSLCPSPYQSFNSDCSCACNVPPSPEKICEGDKVWNSTACDCVCNLTQEDCPKGKFLNSQKCICEGTCTLTDADCQEGYIVNSKCQCVQSECINHPETCFDGNGHWDYRDCECKCNLTQEYCAANGNKVLNPKECICEGCSTSASECEAHNKILDDGTCECKCSDETKTYCSRTPYLELQENNDCACVCNTPAAGTCKGHSFFNSSVETCDCECGYDCSDPWKLNDSQCKCECNLDADKCKLQNENYGFRTSGEEVCECYCTLDLAKCQAKNPNYTFTGNESCGCTCGKTDAICQTESGNQYYGVNNETSCQCQCSATLLEAGVSARNAANAQSGHKGPFFQSNLASCSITCPVTGDDWCRTNYGNDYLADTTHCTCYKSSCAAQTCYNNNGNGHWDYRNCQCQCDIDPTYCTQQGKVFDPDRCECRNDCQLSQEDCENQNHNYKFHDSPYADECYCYCGLNNDKCNVDHGKVLDNQTSCQCVCPTISLGSHQVQNSDTCQPECDNLACTGNWTKDPPTTCTCTVCPNSVSSSCSSQGKAFNSGACNCGNCNPISCAGYWQQNEETCGCIVCELTDSKCSIDNGGNSNWKANKTSGNCSCYCDTVALNAEVAAKGGGWTANASTCKPECPASVQESCNSQNKNFDASSCTCTTCKSNCEYPGQTQHPESNCACTCDKTQSNCSGNWKLNNTVCECNSCEMESTCIAQGKAYDSGACACGSCNPVSCAGQATQNASTCGCECNLTNGNCASQHSDNNNWKANTAIGTCACYCGKTSGECATDHGGNANWKINGDCQCYCDHSSVDSAVTAKGGGWVADYGSTCGPVCPSSVQEGCTAQGKNFDAATCTCTTCASGCSYPGLTQNPSTCACTCNKTNGDCSGYWKLNNTTCACTTCNLTDSKCATDHSNNNNWKANSTGGNCSCYCDHSSVDSAVTAKGGGWVADYGETCGPVCPSSVQEGCTAQGKGFNSTTCSCTGCTGGACSGYWERDPNNNCGCTVCNLVDETCKDDNGSNANWKANRTSGHCECYCSIDNAYCAGQHSGNSNWKANGSCSCYCDTSALNSAVSSLNASGGNWTANTTTCLPECPSSVQTSCTQQGKGFDSTNCKCTSCTGGACSDYWERDPNNNCNCTTCNLTDGTCANDHSSNAHWKAKTTSGNCSCYCDTASLGCSGNWETNASSCACECPSSIETGCVDAGKSYVSSTCSCGSCNPVSCAGEATQNAETCNCQCNLTDSSCSTSHGNNSNWKANTNVNVCGCYCDLSDSSCANSHSGNANWKANMGSCGCYCDTAALNEAVTAKGGGWIANETTCLPECPSSVQTSCTQQGKGFDATTCTCTACTGGACSNYWQRDPNNNCSCSICNLDNATCANDHSSNTHWRANTSSGHCECYCDTASLGCSGNWTTNSSSCACDCPSSVQTGCTNAGKSFVSSTCSCGSCNPVSCAGQATQNASTCNCQCNLTNSSCATSHGNNDKWKANTNVNVCGCYCDTGSTCDGNWQLNTTTCECTTCPPSVQSGCAEEGRAFNAGTCSCGSCNAQSCIGQATQNESTCNCECNLTDGACSTSHSGNANWKANTSVSVCQCYCGKDNAACASDHGGNANWKVNGDCQCYCDHSAVDDAVTAKGGGWTADYGSICGPVCPSSVQESCTQQGKNFDATTCTCTTCINGCQYPGLTQHASDCSCHCDNPPSCTGDWSLNTTKCACECNTSSLATTCADQNRQPKNDGSCTCGSCITDACDGYWTRNQSTCGCTDCNLQLSTCTTDYGANYVVNNSAGHCECQCSIGSDSDCATLHGGNTNWIKNGCGCQCSVNKEVCKGQGKEYNSDTCTCECPGGSCSGDWQKNPSTCVCDVCGLTSCTSPKVINSEKCVCECPNSNGDCPGNWNVNQSTCECTQCDLTDTQCQQLNSNSNYIANKTTCSCECGLTSCLGENTLQGCECVCSDFYKKKQECEKQVGKQFNELMCRCEEAPVTTECLMPMADTGQGHCSCSPYAASYCAGLGLELAYRDKSVMGKGTECYCKEPSSGCQDPWAECKAAGQTYSGCCCGMASSDCTKQGKVLNSAICACVQASSAQCTGNFVEMNGHCVCGLSEDECRKSGMTLFTQGKEHCECVPIGSNVCEWPWVQNGKSCTCGLTEEDCKSPRNLFNTQSTCRCNCPLTIYNCPETTYPDLTTCDCVPLNLCPNFNEQDCYNGNGHFDFTACSCVCDIDSYYCAHAFPQPRYFDPEGCRCVQYAM